MLLSLELLLNLYTDYYFSGVNINASDLYSTILLVN